MHDNICLCIYISISYAQIKLGCKMRTTIDIPEDLINEAMRVTKSPTKTELIKMALLNIIQRNKIQSLKNFKGKIDLEIDLETLRNRNEYSG